MLKLAKCSQEKKILASKKLLCLELGILAKRPVENICFCMGFAISYIKTLFISQKDEITSFLTMLLIPETSVTLSL